MHVFGWGWSVYGYLIVLALGGRYVTVLGAVYLRLVGKPLEIYTLLEPLYSDYRKIRKRNVIGALVVFSCVEDMSLKTIHVSELIGWEITHVDEIVDALLHEEYYVDLSLPRLVDREYFEKNGTLPPRKSVLQDDLDGSGSDDDDDDDEDDE